VNYKITKKDRNIKGHIHLGGSKSISNRVLIIEALAGKSFQKRNLSDSNDTNLMMQLLQFAGNAFNAHDAGTTFRFMTALLSVREGEWILTGSDRMQQRPIGDLVDPLRKLGAQIEYTGKENFPPLKIRGGKIKGGSVAVHSGISSQFASALLMIAPYFEEGLTVELTGAIVSEPYIDMTLSLMNYFSVHHEKRERIIHVPPQEYQPRAVFIESDWSAASYYYEMAAFADELDLTLSGLLQNSFQGDAAIAGIMENFGVATDYADELIHLSKVNQRGRFNFHLNDQPDLAPALFATCGGLSQAAAFTGLGHLQYKESHREEALRNELSKCGIAVGKDGDTITISGKFIPGEYPFKTYLDHRMAMAFAPLAMLCDSVIIEDPLVVKKSYPVFWEDIAQLGYVVE
jgi:3-phosphoshikimate 1-carboxyvinyltransferase